MKIAIIGGTGKMGLWFARFLHNEGKEVIVLGRNEQKLQEIKEQLGVQTATGYEVVAGADQIVILSVPIESFEPVAEQLASYTKPGQIILDVTSIKTKPVATMHRYFRTATILGTHPVFGPGAQDLANQNVVLTPTNQPEIDLARKVTEYLEQRGARVTLMSPQEHDEAMSVVLGLAHFIALVSADTLFNIDQFKQMEAVGGTTFKLLLTLAKSVISEDAEFYSTLQMNIPRVPETEAIFLDNTRIWADIVQNKDRLEFIRKMNEVRIKLERLDPDYTRAYANLYRLLATL